MIGRKYDREDMVGEKSGIYAMMSSCCRRMIGNYWVVKLKLPYYLS